MHGGSRCYFHVGHLRITIYSTRVVFRVKGKSFIIFLSHATKAEYTRVSPENFVTPCKHEAEARYSKVVKRDILVLT